MKVRYAPHTLQQLHVGHPAFGTLPCVQLLKYVINQSRPEAARKADPGMPSAHANSLAFLSTYVSLACAAGTSWQSPPGAALVFGVPTLAVFLVSLLGRQQQHRTLTACPAVPQFIPFLWRQSFDSVCKGYSSSQL